MATTTEDGVEVTQARGVTLVAFAPSRLRVVAVPRPGESAVEPLRAHQALERSGALAVLNGPMFHVGPGDTDYATARVNVPDFALYDARAGIHLAGTRPADGGVLYTSGNAARVVGALDALRDAEAFVQGYPVLVRGGEAVARADQNTGSVWRSAAGVLRDGRVFFAVGHLPMRALAERLVALDALDALHMDGGGSSALLLAGGARYGDDSDRPVASFLACAAPPPPASGGTAAALLLAAAALALLLATVNSGTRRR